MNFQLRMSKNDIENLIEARISKIRNLMMEVQSAQSFSMALRKFINEVDSWREFNANMLSAMFEEKSIRSNYFSKFNGSFYMASQDDLDEYHGLTNEIEVEISYFESLIEQLPMFVEPVHDSKIFEKGQTYDAFKELLIIIQGAFKEVFLIDNYVDEDTLNILSNRKDGVQLRVLTDRKNVKTSFSTALKAFRTQHGEVLLRYSGQVHDRFLVIDKNKVVQVGGSIKDLGKKVATIIVISEGDISNAIIKVAEELWSKAEL